MSTPICDDITLPISKEAGRQRDHALESFEALGVGGPIPDDLVSPELRPPLAEYTVPRCGLRGRLIRPADELTGGPDADSS